MRVSRLATMTTRIRLHYHRPGRGTTLFEERLVLDRADVKVTLLDSYDGPDVFAGDRIILAAAAPVLWFVYPALGRDVGRFHLADGTFTGWYTNLRSPLRMDGSDWYCTDLFLDHWLPADGAAGTWLDEDELAGAVRDGLLEPGHAAIVDAERATVVRLLAQGTWPPALPRTMSLADVLPRPGAGGVTG